MSDNRICFSDDKLQELARRHKAPFDTVRWAALQLHCLKSGVVLQGEDAVGADIKSLQHTGQYRTASLLWFISQALKQGLDEYQMTDLLVPLVAGDAEVKKKS